MEDVKSILLHWTPRVLGVALVVFWMFYVFLSYGFTMVSVVQSIAWLFLLVALLISLKKPYIGGSVYVFLGAIDIVLTFGAVPIYTYLLTTLPVLVVGGLFILEEYVRNR